VSVSGLPPGATFENTVISWTPDVSGTLTTTFTCPSLSGPSQTAETYWYFYAADVLHIDIVNGEAAVQDVLEGAEYEISFGTNFPSGVTFSASGLPDGAVLQNGTVRWVPSVPGTYTFTVSASAHLYVDQTDAMQLTVNVIDRLEFTSVPTADMVVTQNGTSVQFHSMSTNAVSVLWEFSDGQTSNEFNPLMTFAPGEIGVKLTATNPLGSDVTERTLNIIEDEGPGTGNEDPADGTDTVTDITNIIKEFLSGDMIVLIVVAGVIALLAYALGVRQRRK
jgi:hypothetical protein